MRLLHVKTRQLSEFFDEIPPYAVLSHTWGQGELSFEDVKLGRDGYPLFSKKDGFAKFQGCCQQAVEDGLKYVWIDTCCIDKSSSAELSEAINSMFCWYQEARVCYTYLSDVLGTNSAAFTSSLCHASGWTLQELLAPKHHLVATATGITTDFLEGRPLKEASVAQRMSWASRRKTLRKEDTAYCLLGIFGVNMPMVYGEGTKAFVRLQEEILKDSRDLSLFTWGFDTPWMANNSIFAPSPREYLHCSNIQHVGWPTDCGFSETHYFSTNRGLHIHLPVHVHKSTDMAFAILDCGIPDTSYGETDDMLIGLPLPSKNDDHSILVRHKYTQPILIYKDTVREAKFKDAIIEKYVPRDISAAKMTIDIRALVGRGYTLTNVFPPHAIHEVDMERCYVSLLPTDSIMLVLKQPRRGCCFYLHIQSWSDPEFCAVLSPITANEAYLYWRLATATPFLDALEREILEYPDLLLFLEFPKPTVAGSSTQLSSSDYSASDVIGAIKGMISTSKDRSKDPNACFGSWKQKTSPGTIGAIHCEDNLASWNVEFSTFNDAWMEDPSGPSKRLPIATLNVKNDMNGTSCELVSRPRW